MSIDNGISVLVVGGEESARTLMAEVLAAQGFQVQTARDRDAAQVEMREKTFHIVVNDPSAGGAGHERS